MKPEHIAIWKKIFIIVMIISLPLFFAFYRNIQTQNAINTIAVDSKQQGPK